ncbi:MAG: choice-of-anchor J domain-containing protein [Nannocystaceae bacterium]|nr:choice-of-anchor J domain-containing protein [bacterium]
MLIRSSGHALGFVVALSLGCTTVIRAEDEQDPNGSGMTTAAPSGDGSTSGGGTTEPVEDDGAMPSTTDTDTDTDAESGSTGFFPGGAACGNGIIEGSEDCDCGEGNVCAEKELGGIGCVALGSHPDVPGTLTGGVLLCSATSCRYDPANCFYCGDGTINGNETCEPGEPLETSCAELGLGLGEVACGDDCQVDTRGCNACGFVFDFDDGGCDDGWTTGRTTSAAAQSSWECGAAGGFAGGPGFNVSLMWGTDLDGAYQGNESSYLATPALDLAVCGGQDVTMTIRHWFRFEVNDGAVVQVATSNPDAEGSWTTIEPFAGSFYTATVAANHPPVAGNPAFSTFDATEGTWVDAEFDLTEYAGEEEVYVRFVFGSDDTLATGGWYIDDVRILGSTAGG